ncbi:OmpH family outer membrane protein [Pelosinus sp. UFO1]|uniref:OmpH family outer membrane protein n=1 Tax=Pelosinus sp. UFO1 TaxID=484770 RepID=UPI0004D0B385|nr:OmpH family outer membrane protein [Pelosinus sp. UFO1]AIF54185.1 hypothetical protein UFO1_4650 [Pelosinus sp. UFO1]
MSKIKCLAIMLAVCILTLFVFIGSSSAATSLATTEQMPTKSSNSLSQSKSIGFVDVSRIMSESPIVKSFQNELNQKGKELSDQLVIEESNLLLSNSNKGRMHFTRSFLNLKII